MSTDSKDAVNLSEIRRKRREEAEARALADQRPTIRIIAGEMPRVVDDAEAAIIAAGIGLYRHGPRIVEVAWDRIKVSGGGDADMLRLSRVAPARLRELMDRSIRFEKWDGRAEDFVTCGASKDMAETYLARDGGWKVAPILGVIRAPTLRPDGSILAAEGYDAATGLVVNFAGAKFPVIPSGPTREQVVAAMGTLKEILKDYPWVSPVHRSVALSGILTTVVRRSLPSAPMHAFSAPVPGAGKSKLVNVAAVIATGSKAAVTSTGDTDKGTAGELEKRLSASMLGGDAVVSIDNIDRPLSSELLCQLLTESIVKLRTLGVSVNVEVPVTTSFFATANNLALVGDLTRRALVAQLAPDAERPELTPFGFDPVEMAFQRRGEFLVAALTILRGWAVSGESMKLTPFGSFEAWSKRVREAIIWAGEPDPLEVIEEVRAADPKLGKLKAMIETWGAVFGQAAITVADVIAEAMKHEGANGEGERAHPDFLAAILGVASSNDGVHVNAERLGWWLRRNSGRVVNGAKFVREDDGARTKWFLAGEKVPVLQVLSRPDEEIPF